MSNTSPKTPCHVAIGVIVQQKQVLVAQRPLHVAGGGLWEFPGGKVELGESVKVALARELAEEVGIVVQEADPLLQLEYQYPDCKYLLDAWLVINFTGKAEGLEGQTIKWVPINELSSLNMLLANAAIIDALLAVVIH